MAAAGLDDARARGAIGIDRHRNDDAPLIAGAQGGCGIIIRADPSADIAERHRVRRILPIEAGSDLPCDGGRRFAVDRSPRKIGAQIACQMVEREGEQRKQRKRKRGAGRQHANHQRFALPDNHANSPPFPQR